MKKEEKFETKEDLLFRVKVITKKLETAEGHEKVKLKNELFSCGHSITIIDRLEKLKNPAGVEMMAENKIQLELFER